MDYKKSCGYVVYKLENNKILYLVLQSLNGEWGFPKGHVEKDESEIETANRELFEETPTDWIKYNPATHNGIYHITTSFSKEIAIAEHTITNPVIIIVKLTKSLSPFNPPTIGKKGIAKNFFITKI